MTIWSENVSISSHHTPPWYQPFRFISWGKLSSGFMKLHFRVMNNSLYTFNFLWSGLISVDYSKLAFCDLKPNRTVNKCQSQGLKLISNCKISFYWLTLLPWGLFQFLSSPPPGFLMFSPSLHHRQISANWREVSSMFSYQTLPSPGPADIFPENLELHHCCQAVPPDWQCGGIGLIKMYTLHHSRPTPH